MQKLEQIVARHRTAYFYASALLYFLCNVVLIILIPVTMIKIPFFNIYNKSNYPEIANAFQRIEFDLRGNCIYFVGNSQICKKMTIFEMFYRMPDFSHIPTKVLPSQIADVFQIIPGQNPLLFIPLFLSILGVLVSFILSGIAFRKTTRKSIVFAIISSAIVSSILIFSLIICTTVYENGLIPALNKPITVVITKKSQNSSFEVTGKPSDIGINFVVSAGRTYLISILVVSLVSTMAAIRWIFEGNVPKNNTAQIRIND